MKFLGRIHMAINYFLLYFAEYTITYIDFTHNA